MVSTTPKVQDSKNLEKLLKIASDLTNVKQLSSPISEGEFNMRLVSLETPCAAGDAYRGLPSQRAVAPFGEVISNKGKYKDEWAVLKRNPDIEGAHETNEKLTKYLAYLVEQRLVQDKLNPRQQVAEEFNYIISTNNFAVEFFKKTAPNFREETSGNGNSFTFPDWSSTKWRTVAEKWGGSKNYVPAEQVESNFPSD